MKTQEQHTNIAPDYYSLLLLCFLKVLSFLQNARAYATYL